MHKVLISLPDQLVTRMKSTIPDRQRSKLVAVLLEAEIIKREKALYECALAVEQDMALKNDMALWDVTIGDGLENVDRSASKKKRKS